MEELESYHPFCNLNQDSLGDLKAIVHFKYYKKQEIVFYEEDKVSDIYFLLEGAVKAYKVDRFDNEIFFGIFKNGLLNDCKDKDKMAAFVNIECLEDSLIACFESDKLRLLFEKSPQILKLFFEESLKRVGVLEEIVQRELVFDSTAKIAYSLYSDLEEFNMHKKQENAAFLNIQPETLSRILKKLHRDGVIQTNSLGKIEILDSQRLQMIFKQEAK
ncbi:cAMP-binding protein [Helicobacter pullorum]|uniref:Crp/Fnr family transcriptional regulator n=1 Tax=Helicobacter pullorum TaxID=35818 RepID=UPI0008169259|nr:Crp/Fnr family transcriptional regulator [Helicobacter pullorum]OCR03086.1 cAMP-binding protein [Helicobacter pullorum]OCR08421.1 cAMP-binding protein [Helicobacter pullorum]OCR08804.1 cAMP-binding protein [Helicobacter pullorum]OCR12911.1 cAMP-binding protein [Helicobacter pullorum]